MQDGIALVEPSRLIVHEVLDRSSGQGCHASVNFAQADMHSRSWAVWVKQGRVVAYLYFRLHRSDRQLNLALDGDCGSHLDGGRLRGEARLLCPDSVNAVGQGFDIDQPSGVGCEFILILICLAGESDQSLETK